MTPLTDPPRRLRIGVLGGSFDPVHLGHLRIAEAVRDTFELPRVLLVPCAIQPHKPAEALSPARHRLRMLELAVAGRDRLEVSTIELDRGGTSYTIDTLRALREDARDPVDPLFVMGMDSLAEITSWKDWRALLDEFDHVVIDRPRDHPPADVFEPVITARLAAVPARPGAGAERLRQMRKPGGALHRLEIEPIPISASRIRRRARRGESLHGLVPPTVARYIERERLYGQEGPR